MSYLHDSLAQLKIFEGVIHWMYLDTRGYVTVGVGEMLLNAARAQSLAFVDTNNQPSAPDAILADYNRVSTLLPGMKPGFYRALASPTLPAAAIDAILTQHLISFDAQLNQRFTSYSNFPDPAKLGLLDMIYNLGPAKLFDTYPHLMVCVQNRDWANAAKECYRCGPGPDRNNWTKQQFLAAAAAIGDMVEKD